MRRIWMKDLFKDLGEVRWAKFGWLKKQKEDKESKLVYFLKKSPERRWPSINTHNIQVTAPSAISSSSSSSSSLPKPCKHKDWTTDKEMHSQRSKLWLFLPSVLQCFSLMSHSGQRQRNKEIQGKKSLLFFSLPFGSHLFPLSSQWNLCSGGE